MNSAAGGVGNGVPLARTCTVVLNPSRAAARLAGKAAVALASSRWRAARFAAFSAFWAWIFSHESLVMQS